MVITHLHVGQPHGPSVPRPVADFEGFVRHLVFGIHQSQDDHAVGEGEADEYMPDAVQVGEINPLPETAKQAVTDPASKGESPYNCGDLNQMLELLIFGPREGRREIKA